MPIVMIFFFLMADQPTVVQVEINTLEACMHAGAPLAENLGAVGICMDKFTGRTVTWGPRPPGATGPGNELPDWSQPVPEPKGESH